MLSFGLPLALPGIVDFEVPAESRQNAKPRTATQLYREVDRLMTTVVRGTEVRTQQR